MSETQYTPGPWSVSHRDWRGQHSPFRPHIIGPGTIEKRDGVMSHVGIAIVEGNGTSMAVTDANARMISAAPEMFSSLANVLDAMRHGDRETIIDVFESLRPEIERVLNKAMAK